MDNKKAAPSLPEGPRLGQKAAEQASHRKNSMAGSAGQGEFPRPLDLVLSRLENVKEHAGAYSAKCPAHQDRRASLSVKEAPDGKTLLHCFAGCSLEAVLTALSLEKKDLFPRRKEVRTWGSVSGLPEKVYPYVDDTGKLLFEVCRFPGKRFAQRRPDGKGGFIWNLGDVGRVLYRLPEVLAGVREGKPVHLVEGEKDADSLSTLGLVATTNPGGAGKWQPEYGQALQGAKVIILPDNDEPGRAHAMKVAAHLFGAAAEVRILELPGLPPKGDVSDWFQAAGTREELERLAGEVPPWQPEGKDLYREWRSPDGQYAVAGGTTYQVRPGDSPGEEKLHKLANFAAWIVEETILDDGSGETSRFFTLEGWLARGKPLHPVKVAVTRFSAMTWPVEEWGAGVRIAAGTGKRDHLRAAVQERSGDEIPVRTVYGHLGWRKTADGWAFLHGGGALGLERVSVDLEPELAPYQLPTGERNEEEEREAIQASFSFLDMGEKKTLFPLYAALWRSVLCEWLPFPAVLWLEGESGAFKSTTAGLGLCHFGQFGKDALPASWIDSANRLEHRAFLVKDLPLVVDDFNPEKQNAPARQLEERASRLIRSIGNRQGRGRLRIEQGTGKLVARTTYVPRGLIIATAEQRPNLPPSGLARLFPVPFERGGIREDKLAALQAKAGILPLAARAYLEWLRPKAEDNLGERVRQRFEELREKAHVEGHARLPEAVASLYLGLELFLVFALEAGAVEEDRAGELGMTGWEVIMDLAREHGQGIEREKPSQVFIEALREGLAAGECYLCDRETGMSLGRAGNQAKKIGWADGGGTYLLPGVAYEFAATSLRSRGGLALAERALHRMLDRDGLLAGVEERQLTKRVRCEGKPERVLYLRAGILEPGGPGDPAFQDEAAAAAEPEEDFHLN